MKLAEGARFDCGRSTQEFTCYMAGFAYPPAITPAVGRPARCTVTLPGDTGSVGDVAPHRKQASLRIWGGQIPYPRFTGPDHAAMHPLRLGTPVTSRYTRSEGVQCLRIGCTAPHNKHNCGQFLPTHPSGSIRRSHTTSKYPPGSEQDALHPFRRATPVPSRCTRSVAIHPIRKGAMPTDRVHRLPQQAQLRKY